VYPALQVQSATASLELGELELPGHVTQVDAAVAPVEAEYVPTPQTLHSISPVLILYFPVLQALHVFPAVELVRSTPCTMASTIAVVEAVLMYSSTTSTPAMSAFKEGSPLLLLAIQLCVNVLSIIAVAIVPVLVTAPFTDIE